MDDKNKKIIIAANPGGIANRIKCLISMWRLSDLYNRKLYLYWIKNHTCGADFSDLFENDFPEIKREHLRKIKKKNIKFYGGNTSEIFDSSHKYIISNTWRFMLLPGEIPDKFSKAHPTEKGNNIDYEFERIPLNVRKKILQYLNKIKPIKPIKITIDKFAKKHNLKNTVGVHVRRDDFLIGKEGLGKVSPDNKFFEKMKEILKDNPKTKFSLCTDCQETEDKFIKKFGKKIIVFPKKNRDRTTVINTQEGLIDLLLLSKTKQIIGTYFSTFNEMAWWLGGCKAKVFIVKDENLKKEWEYKKNMFDENIFLKIKRFMAKLLGRTSAFKQMNYKVGSEE